MWTGHNLGNMSNSTCFCNSFNLKTSGNSYIASIQENILSVADLGGASPPPLATKFFSISCSFRGENLNFIPAAPAPRVGAPLWKSWIRHWLLSLNSTGWSKIFYWKCILIETHTVFVLVEKNLLWVEDISRHFHMKHFVYKLRHF